MRSNTRQLRTLILKAKAVIAYFPERNPIPQPKKGEIMVNDRNRFSKDSRASPQKSPQKRHTQSYASNVTNGGGIFTGFRKKLE